MYVNALGTALPEKRYTKRDCWEAFTASEWFGLLEPRSRAVTKLVLTRANGIDERWLSVDSLDEVFAIDVVAFERICVIGYFPGSAGGELLACVHARDDRLIRGGCLGRGGDVLHAGSSDHVGHRSGLQGSSCSNRCLYSGFGGY